MESRVRAIAEHFGPLCMEVRMTEAIHERLLRRAVLNPDISAGCEERDPGDGDIGGTGGAE